MDPAADGNPDNPASRHFRGYGLRFDSEIDLPWPEGAPGGEPDVSIRLGEVPPALESPTDSLGYWQAAPGALLVRADGMGGCLVSNGGRRVVGLPRFGGQLVAVA